MKMCSRCKQEKPIEAFKRDSRYTAGVSSFCKTCHQDATVAWQRANPDRVKEVRRKRYSERKDAINAARRNSYDSQKAWSANLEARYSLNAETYNNIIQRQNGCAICGKSPSSDKRRFHVDHDHNCCSNAKSCGRCVRGILCHSCNTALHVIEHDKSWPNKAIAYLEKANGRS